VFRWLVLLSQSVLPLVPYFSDLSARRRLRLVFTGIALSATREAPSARALGGIVSALPFSESSNGKLWRRDAKHSKYLATSLVALPTSYARS
jgi:hypothetical protein